MLSKDIYSNVQFSLKPYPLQQEILDYMDGVIKNREGEAYRFFVVAFGRQSGKSWLAKYVVLNRAIKQGQQCMWISPSNKSSDDHWNKLVSLIEKAELPVKKIRVQQKEITFLNGGSIRIRSALEKENLRGATLDVIVADEAAFYWDGERIWYNVLQPMVTASRGIVLFTTTPNGQNWFYNLYKAGLEADNLYYKSWHMTSMEAPYQDKKLLKELKRTMPKSAWEEEYEAKFLADKGGVFIGVQEASTASLLSSPETGHFYVAGIDWGVGDNDPTVITIVDKFSRTQVYGERLFNLGTTLQIERIITLLDLWNPQKTAIETNSVGGPLIQLLREKLAGDQLYIEQKAERTSAKKHVLIPIHVDNKKKRRLIEKLAHGIEYGHLSLLSEKTAYGKIQISEMSTFQRERTSTSLDITYKAAANHHDDTVMALSFAYSLLPKLQKWRVKREKPIIVDNPFRNRKGARLRSG